MNKNTNVLGQFYSVWRETNAVYDDWAQSHGLSANETIILQALLEDEKPCTQKSICQKWHCPKQTVNTILRNYQKMGYVQLHALPADKRNKEIVLTQAGTQYAESIINRLHEREIHVMNQMGEEKIAQLNSLMAEFSTCFKEQEDDHA